MSTALNFYKFSPYDSDTKQQLWLSQMTDAHDTWCGCTEPIAHFLSAIFPPDHKDYNCTIKQIVTRRHKELQWYFGGKDERSGGEAEEGPSTKENIKQTKEDEDFADLNVEELIAAAEEPERQR